MRTFAALLLLPALALAADPADNALKNLDIFELEVAADPQISPDGATIVYARRAMDIMSDRGVANLWTINVDGSMHRPLVSGPESYTSPRWSPSGDRIAYVSRVDGRGPQLHVRWMDTGQTAVLTNMRFSPSSITWSPDGSKIAFSRFVPGKTEPLATAPDKPKGAKWAAPVKVIGEKGILRDRPGFDVDLMTRKSASGEMHKHDRPSVLMPVRGHWRVNWEGGHSATLAPGDTMSFPAGILHNALPSMTGEASLYHIVATDDPAGATWRP